MLYHQTTHPYLCQKNLSLMERNLYTRTVRTHLEEKMQ